MGNVAKPKIDCYSFQWLARHQQCNGVLQPQLGGPHSWTDFEPASEIPPKLPLGHVAQNGEGRDFKFRSARHCFPVAYSIQATAHDLFLSADLPISKSIVFGKFFD